MEVTLRAVPHVRVGLTFVDSAGKPVEPGRSGGEVIGKMGEMYVGSTGHRDAAGGVSFLVPRGLQEAFVHLSPNDEGTVGYRRGAAGPVFHTRRIDLGTLDHDVDEIVVIYRKSPTLVVQAVDPQGQPIANFKPRVDYPPGTTGAPQNHRWPSGIDGQAMLGPQPDGRWRSYGLLPDQEFTLTLQADGYRSASKTLKLAEGQVEEVHLRLEPTPPGEAAPEEFKPPENQDGFRLVYDLGPFEETPKSEGPPKPTDAPADEPLPPLDEEPSADAEPK
jgi:hypothetical protein